jgi:hypothetical protein
MLRYNIEVTNKKVKAKAELKGETKKKETTKKKSSK